MHHLRHQHYASPPTSSYSTSYKLQHPSCFDGKLAYAISEASEATRPCALLQTTGTFDISRIQLPVGLVELPVGLVVSLLYRDPRLSHSALHQRLSTFSPSPTSPFLATPTSTPPPNFHHFSRNFDHLTYASLPHPPRELAEFPILSLKKVKLAVTTVRGV